MRVIRWELALVCTLVASCSNSTEAPSLDIGSGDTEMGTGATDMNAGELGLGAGGDLSGTAGKDLAAASPDLAPVLGASVLQLHNHANRDGVYVEPTFTTTALATLHIDPAFDGAYAQSGASGPVYAQALFVDRGGAGDLVIVATEQNYLLAFNAVTGKIVWHTDPAVIGTAAPASAFSCGNVNPSGITGTPVIDLATHAIFFQADVFDGTTLRHLIHSISIDDGTTRAGWPIDVKSIIPDFGSPQQGQRGALIVIGDQVFVPFGGRYGDCVPYRGYVVGLPLTNPSVGAAVVFQTKAQNASGAGAGAGIWAPTGLASDGVSLYFATGNTKDTYPTDWTISYSNGIFRLPPSLAFKISDPTSYFSPPDWHSLDLSDTDISGSGVLLVDVPGAATPHLAVTLGKDSKIYLLDRNNLGGAMTTPPFSGSVAGGEIINAPAAYTTTQGTWVAFRAICPGGGPTTINAVRLTGAPGIGTAWCANVDGGGSPIVSTTGGGLNTVVWFVSSEGEGVTPDNKLHGFDGDTGAPIVTTAAMTSTHRFVSPIVAKGRIYVAADQRLYSFIK